MYASIQHFDQEFYFIWNYQERQDHYYHPDKKNPHCIIRSHHNHTWHTISYNPNTRKVRNNSYQNDSCNSTTKFNCTWINTPNSVVNTPHLYQFPFSHHLDPINNTYLHLNNPEHQPEISCLHIYSNTTIHRIYQIEYNLLLIHKMVLNFSTIWRFLLIRYLILTKQWAYLISLFR